MPRPKRSDLDTVRIQVDYCPRYYFQPYHERTQRFACIVAHRRAGKTVACIHDLQRMALTSQHARSLFAYIAPTYSQAKATAFDYLIEAAAPFIRYGAKVNQSELKVDYPNGSTIRLFGADNYHALRGLRLDGAVLDEYADFDPRAWTQVIRPALSDRRGVATFIGTPRGHNDFWKIFRDAQSNSAEWYTASFKASELVPINDRDSQAVDHGLLTSDELEQAKRQMSDEWYQQEYECDFESANVGAYYGKQMAQAQKDGRIGVVPWDPAHRVVCAWDIGGDRDATAIWFAQVIGRQVCLIDYYEMTGSDVGPHVKYVTDRPYNVSQHFLPHDAGPNRIGIDRSYQDFLRDLGLRNTTVLPVQIREHGIEAVRLLLPRCYFDAEKCASGVEALKMYQTEWDEKNKVFKSTPKHDWSSHGADAARYLAVGIDSHITSSSFNRKLVYPKGLQA